MKKDNRYPQWNFPADINIGDKLIYKITREIFTVTEKLQVGYLLQGKSSVFLYDWNRKDFIKMEEEE